MTATEVAVTTVLTNQPIILLKGAGASGPPLGATSVPRLSQRLWQKQGVNGQTHPEVVVLAAVASHPAGVVVEQAGPEEALDLNGVKSKTRLRHSRLT